MLKPGMIITVGPGLYFKSGDLLVPDELRGIGVRIEDDVLMTSIGNENLSAGPPRSVATSKHGWPRSGRVLKPQIVRRLA